MSNIIIDLSKEFFKITNIIDYFKINNIQVKDFENCKIKNFTYLFHLNNNELDKIFNEYINYNKKDNYNKEDNYNQIINTIISKIELNINKNIDLYDYDIIEKLFCIEEADLINGYWYFEYFINLTIKQYAEVCEFTNYYTNDSCDGGVDAIKSYIHYITNRSKEIKGQGKDNILEQYNTVKDYCYDCFDYLEDINGRFSYTDTKIDGLIDFYGPYTFWEDELIPELEENINNSFYNLKQSIIKLLDENKKLLEENKKLKEEK